MKLPILISLVSFLFSVHSFAAAKEQNTMKTLFTCAQERGNEWLEIGIAVNDGWSFKAVLVKHDDFADKLVAFRQAYKTETDDMTIYEDSDSAMRVSLTKDHSSADLYIRSYSRGPVDLRGLSCTQNSTISFDL